MVRFGQPSFYYYCISKTCFCTCFQMLNSLRAGRISYCFKTSKLQHAYQLKRFPDDYLIMSRDLTTSRIETNVFLFPQKPKIYGTGWPKSKSVISNGCTSKTVLFWPYVGKAKMCFRCGSFFQFSKICLHFSALCLQFFKKDYRILALPT